MRATERALSEETEAGQTGALTRSGVDSGAEGLDEAAQRAPAGGSEEGDERVSHVCLSSKVRAGRLGEEWKAVRDVDALEYLPGSLEARERSPRRRSDRTRGDDCGKPLVRGAQVRAPSGRREWPSREMMDVGRTGPRAGGNQHLRRTRVRLRCPPSLRWSRLRRHRALGRSRLAHARRRRVRVSSAKELSAHSNSAPPPGHSVRHPPPARSSKFFPPLLAGPPWSTQSCGKEEQRGSAFHASSSQVVRVGSLELEKDQALRTGQRVSAARQGSSKHGERLTIGNE